MTTTIRPAIVRLNASAVPPAAVTDADEALGRMAGSLAHDLNNILQILQGNLSLLARDGVAEGARHRIDNSLAAIRTGAELTGGVLEYCRQRTTEGSGATVIDAAQMVAMAPTIQDAAGEHIGVVAAVEDDLWPIQANAHRLRNVLINLAVNSRDAMGGRGRLLFGARNICCPVAGEQVWVTLADEGPGISQEVIERMFTPFYTTKPSGTGLGLATVAEFARTSAADVVIDSRPGLGTSVTIEFPRFA